MVVDEHDLAIRLALEDRNRNAQVALDPVQAALRKLPTTLDEMEQTFGADVVPPSAGN